MSKKVIMKYKTLPDDAIALIKDKFHFVNKMKNIELECKCERDMTFINTNEVYGTEWSVNKIKFNYYGDSFEIRDIGGQIFLRWDNNLSEHNLGSEELDRVFKKISYGQVLESSTKYKTIYQKIKKEYEIINKIFITRIKINFQVLKYLLENVNTFEKFGDSVFSFLLRSQAHFLLTEIAKMLEDKKVNSIFNFENNIVNFINNTLRSEYIKPIEKTQLLKNNEESKTLIDNIKKLRDEYLAHNDINSDANTIIKSYDDVIEISNKAIDIIHNQLNFWSLYFDEINKSKEVSGVDSGQKLIQVLDYIIRESNLEEDKYVTYADINRITGEDDLE